MKNKSRRKLTTILGLVPLLVLLFGIVGGVTYALVNGTKAKSKHGFEVSVRGAVNVSADITGKSYKNNTLVETLGKVSFDGSQEQSTEQTSSFGTSLDIDNTTDTASFVFEIKNTTQETKYTDLMIEPIYNADEYPTIATTMTYSEDGVTYQAIEDLYIVAEKGETVYVKVEITITELASDINLVGTIEFNLYSEDGVPAQWSNFTVEDGVLTKYEGNESIVTIPDTVTSIANEVFMNNKYAKEVIIPETVTSLGQSVFKNSNLETITIPSSIKDIPIHTFNNAQKLSSVTLHDGIRTIGNSSFASCSSLKQITLPANITTITGWTFKNSGLESIVIPANVTKITQDAFRNCANLKTVEMNEKVSIIEQYAFHDCPKLETLDLPDTLTTLGRNAFSNCDLKEVYLGTNIKDIPYEAFARNSNLSQLTLSNGIETFGYNAFGGIAITELTIPETVISIDNRTFNSLKNLKKINIPASVTSIHNYAFMNSTAIEEFVVDSLNPNYETIEKCLVETATMTLVQGTNEGVIADGIKIVSENSFSGYLGFTDLVVPSSVERIMANAFQDCTNLTTLTLNEGLKEIQGSVFKNTNLSTVVFPETIEIIRAYSFQNTNVVSVIIPESCYMVGKCAFANDKLESITFSNTEDWYFSNASYGSETTPEQGTPADVTNPTGVAQLMMKMANGEETSCHLLKQGVV